MNISDLPVIESPVPLPPSAFLRGADKVYCISFPEHDLHVDFRCEDAQRDGILASAITDMLAAIRSAKPETGAPMPIEA